MDFKVKVFLSYSIKDKDFAVRFVNGLKDYPFIDIFMAPEDIKAGTFWVDELRYHLKNSDVILSLLTNNYHEADWTEQEIGLAWAFEKRILALSIDGNMGNGYVKNIQIKKFPVEYQSWDLTDLALDLYPPIKDKKEFVEGLLKFGLLASRSFYESNATARLAKRLVDRIDPRLAFFIVEAYCKNDQVQNSIMWGKLIKEALCTDKSFIHFDQKERMDILFFIKENEPEFYEEIKKAIDTKESKKF